MRVSDIAEFHLFPRLKGCGSIEARCSQKLYPNSRKFPRLKGCGSIEAERPRIDKIARGLFPRLKGCGSIEADSPGVSSDGDSDFRG